MIIRYTLVIAALLPLQLHADFFGSSGDLFALEFVAIRDPGNLPKSYTDSLGAEVMHGGVNRHFRMSVTEVSRSMIETYNALSGGPAISLADMSSFTGNGPDRPATGISWNEAARFVNWLNAQKGFPPAYKFESGGANANISLWELGETGYEADNPFRNSDAYYFLPDEDEWFKAAYYDGDVADYWTYATGSDTPPTAIASGTAEGTTVHLATGPANVDEAGGLSPYGTMAQNGNVWEWTESGVLPPNDAAGEDRILRGGNWNDNSPNSGGFTVRFKVLSPTTQFDGVGFRVAALQFDIDEDGLLDTFEDEHFGDNSGTVEPSDLSHQSGSDDPDGDGLNNSGEQNAGTDPNLADTDEDGFNDLAEIQAGKDPLDENDTPDAIVEIYTAVEFIFYSENGATYQIEWSNGLDEWTTLPEIITGTGASVTRFYSTRGEPKRFFRATKLTAP